MNNRIVDMFQFATEGADWLVKCAKLPGTKLLDYAEVILSVALLILLSPLVLIGWLTRRKK